LEIQSRAAAASSVSETVRPFTRPSVIEVITRFSACCSAFRRYCSGSGRKASSQGSRHESEALARNDASEGECPERDLNSRQAHPAQSRCSAGRRPRRAFRGRLPRHPRHLLAVHRRHPDRALAPRRSRSTGLGAVSILRLALRWHLLGARPS
jgi:hypothetical protein